MSETTYQHYRTGTFTAVVEGSDPPESVTLRYDRHGNIVHLTVPPGATAGVLAVLPEWIIPSATGEALLPSGSMALRRGGRTVTLTGAAGGGTLHYLAIPGQAEEPEEPEAPEEPASPPEPEEPPAF